MNDHTPIYQKLYPTLKTLEEERQQILGSSKFTSKRAVGFVGLGLLVLWLLSIATNHYHPQSWMVFLAAFALFCVVITFAYPHEAIKALRQRYKKQVIATIVETFEAIHSYHPEQFIKQVVFDRALWFAPADSYTGEDFIYGKLDKTNFQCSEIHAEGEIKNPITDTYTRYTYVKGFLMVADFHKDFQGHTVVVPKGHRYDWTTFKITPMTSVAKAQLEHPDFNRLFEVYTNHPVEARYILSPQLMEQILELKAQLGQIIYFSFVNSKIYIAIDWGRDLLRPPVNSSFLEEQAIKNYCAEIELCLSLIEQLHLNTRIWTKE